MKAIDDLNIMLKKMNPKIIKEDLVFCTISEKQLSGLKIKPMLIFREAEGVTIVVKKAFANANKLSYSSIWSLITLNIHSDLLAIGFLASVTRELARAGISVNVVSAFYHDHLFVPKPKAEKAIKILKQLAKS